ncbi:acetylglutamate kinase [Sporosarcina sp. FA9]|uniref:acetylglutamate kinase n=1 Tax=Sporosarcina sp. FA9 TaxID=3413030 RepID=UPI003F65CFE6
MMHPYGYCRYCYSCISKTEVGLKNHMRLIWEQHIAWTRMTIMGLVFNLPDIDFVTARLLQNATDNGNAIRPFYGDQIAEMYESLIKEHLVLAANLVKAAKAGDQKAVADTDKKWHANADRIAEFLNRINPYIPENEFKKMMYDHLGLTKAEAVLMLQKDYKSSIDTYDKIETQALEMADMISGGIVKQFNLSAYM